MNIFVASWFFPPALSSEGIVAFKLLSHSKHHYDVCSSSSDKWSYHRDACLEADNVDVIPVETDCIGTWVDEAVRIFEERHAVRPYDAIMTRSMPPEAIEVGQRVHEAHPDIPWIASIADPIGKSPYDIKAWLVDGPEAEQDKQLAADFRVALKYGCDGWLENENPHIVTMVKLKAIEDMAIKNAAGLIFPHDALRHYVLGTRKRANAATVVHSFDTALFPHVDKKLTDRITLTFTGHSDVVRSLEPIVRAANMLRTIDEQALDKLRFRFVGHVPEEVRALVYNYDLYSVINIEDSVDYLESLAIMEQSDWLVHVDALFDFLDEPGGSVYFAGKLADYMATDAPILSITGTHSPSYEITRRAGGVCVSPDDIAGLAEVLCDIAAGKLRPHIDREYRDRYDAQSVAGQYDEWIGKVVEEAKATGLRPFDREFWPEVPDEGSCKQKLISICVPAYGVECTLDRCLFSLVSSRVADQLEIIVVDDGSRDNSAAIALAYAEHYPSIVKVIRKKNGGHGSTINAALAQATGTYFRVVDGDDWLDSDNLATLVENVRAQDELADLVSTNYHQVYAEDGHLVKWIKISDYDNYRLYDFATTDMTMEYFTMASMMAKTQILKDADFKIQENTYYVDVEFILFAIPFIKTVMFTPEYVYRYAVGNADQSINFDVFVSRYDHHDRVMRRMVRYYADHCDTMGNGQRTYMKTIFVEHLLNTHYLLSVMYDPDKERGFARAADFDAFLKQTAPDLHTAFGRAHLPIVALRAGNFDPVECPRPRTLENFSPIQSTRKAVRAAANVVEGLPGGYRLVHNRYTRAIANLFRH